MDVTMEHMEHNTAWPWHLYAMCGPAQSWSGEYSGAFILLKVELFLTVTLSMAYSQTLMNFFVMMLIPIGRQEQSVWRPRWHDSHSWHDRRRWPTMSHTEPPRHRTWTTSWPLDYIELASSRGLRTGSPWSRPTWQRWPTWWRWWCPSLWMSQWSSMPQSLWGQLTIMEYKPVVETLDWTHQPWPGRNLNRLDPAQTTECQAGELHLNVMGPGLQIISCGLNWRQASSISGPCSQSCWLCAEETSNH